MSKSKSIDNDNILHVHCLMFDQSDLVEDNKCI